MTKNKTVPLENGKRFGRLIILEFHHQDKRWRRFYLCKCDCGNMKIIQGSLMISGNTKSCGCLSKEAGKLRAIPNNGGVVNHIILQYKRHAKDRGIKWSLSRSCVDRIIRLPCNYCGTIGGNLKKTKNCREGFRHNGIDRVDSSKAYTKNNIVPCCGLCNRSKRDMPRDVFLEWAKRVSNYQNAMATQWGSLTP